MTLLLLAVAVRVRRAPTTGRLLLVVAAFGLAGSLRPTIPLLSSPLLVWLFWGRPVRDWALAVIVGVASVAVWAAPMIAMTGGWSMYQRANRALVADIFVANYSLFSPRSHPVLVVANIASTAWWGAIALMPLLAWSAARGRPRPWARAWFAVIGLNLAFYAAVYAGEAGYLAAVAGLACLVPATWACGGQLPVESADRAGRDRRAGVPAVRSGHRAVARRSDRAPADHPGSGRCPGSAGDLSRRRVQGRGWPAGDRPVGQPDHHQQPPDPAGVSRGVPRAVRPRDVLRAAPRARRVADLRPRRTDGGADRRPAGAGSAARMSSCRIRSSASFSPPTRAPRSGSSSSSRPPVPRRPTSTRSRVSR